MIENINDQLRRAQIAKEKDDVINHPENVKRAVINFMKSSGVNKTPEIKANGHKVIFKDPTNLKMVVDGKEFAGKEMDLEINRIDMIGPDMKNERNKLRIKDIAQKEVKNVVSVAKVSAIRSTVSAPIREMECGERTVGSLLHGLWALIQKTIQR